MRVASAGECESRVERRQGAGEQPGGNETIGGRGSRHTGPGGISWPLEETAANHPVGDSRIEAGNDWPRDDISLELSLDGQELMEPVGIGGLVVIQEGHEVCAPGTCEHNRL